jgi:phage protein D
VAKQVNYALEVDGRPASADVLAAVRRVEVEDHSTLADMLRLRLALAVKQDASGWTLLDDAVFKRLAKLKLSVTVGSGNATPLIEAYVVEVDTELSNDPNGSLLTVTAMDATVLMHLEEKVKEWPNMMDSDVASSIFSDAAYNLTPVVESTQFTRQENDQTLIQRGTDIQFLRHLAERNGYECFVESNDGGQLEGHFHPPKHDGQPQGTLTVNMGDATNVNKFRARFDMFGPATAKATTVDPDDASTQEGDVSETKQADGMGDTPTIPSDHPRQLLLSQLGMGKADEVQRYAQSVVDRSGWSIVADGELNTLAYGGVVRAKKPILVRGAGRQFSGRYYVERVLHVIDADGSYVQRFSLRRNATGLTGQENFRSDDAIAG